MEISEKEYYELQLRVRSLQNQVEAMNSPRKITLKDMIKEQVISGVKNFDYATTMEVLEVQKLDINPSYTIADELVSGAIPSWIRHLRSLRGIKAETPAARTSGESR